MTPEILDALVVDPHIDVACAAAKNPSTQIASLKKAIGYANELQFARSQNKWKLLNAIASNPNATTDLLDELMQQRIDNKTEIDLLNRMIVKNPNASQEIVHHIWSHSKGETQRIAKETIQTRWHELLDPPPEAREIF